MEQKTKKAAALSLTKVLTYLDNRFIGTRINNACNLTNTLDIEVWCDKLKTYKLICRYYTALSCRPDSVWCVGHSANDEHATTFKAFKNGINDTAEYYGWYSEKHNWEVGG